MFEIVLELISEIAVPVVVVLVGIGISWYRENVKDEKIRGIIADGVLFAQQVFGHLEGKQRFKYAKDKAIQRLENKGFKVSEEDINTLIESVLKELKSEYGDNWYDIIKDGDTDV